MCRYIAFNILGSNEDAEECVNDVLLALWNAIPPDIPADFGAYIGRAVRNRSLEILRASSTQKRGGGVTVLGEEQFDYSFIVHILTPFIKVNSKTAF